ncbi:glycoside hydrolase family 99-like domain-containing protein [Gemmobacter serpentinus]|uniref:glycoside hydrolase family 99-like domain-containing protein n=1 Tax=Gemmobacter serpentinus TaxID=2652247 RepID=UPI0018658744|nr:glycoside hydrolase family 99-like domain-containing protein [Gemmobacter serpentinus]
MSVVNWDLHNLDQGPEWRGAIDHFDGRWLRGWAVSARAPGQDVQLDIRLYGVDLPAMSCDIAREDIARLFPHPVRAGFDIDLGLLPAGIASLLLAHLHAAAPVSQIDAVLEVRVGGSGLRLPFSPGVADGSLASAQLRPMLEEILAKAPPAPPTVTGISATGIPPAEIAGTDIPGAGGILDHAARLEVIAFYDPALRPAGYAAGSFAEEGADWLRIAASRALYPGHDQPHLPGRDPGFYDPRDGSALRGQIAQARTHGLTGFCYPAGPGGAGQALIAQHLEQGDDFGFCLHLQIEARDVADPAALFRDSLPRLAAPAYIRLAGAPLLLVSGLELLPDPAGALASWRAIARHDGITRLHLCLVERAEARDPRVFGCDSSCQPLPEAPALQLPAPAGRAGVTGDYAGLVAGEIARPSAGHLRLGCALPGHDDSPLRGAEATIWQGASPALFAAWTGHLADLARQGPAEGRAIFINAWNGWAGGSYLEPDQQLGTARLVALRDALAMDAEPDPDEIEMDPAPARADMDLPRQLVGLARANAALTGLLRRQGAQDSPGPDHGGFVAAPPELMRVTPHPAGRAQIEQLNGLPPQDGLLPLARAGGIALTGWFLLPGTDPFPALISLQDDQGRRHVALLRHAQPRPDLAQGQALAGQTASGFSFRGGLGGLPAGRYRIELLRPDARDPGLAHAAGTGCLLLIG